MALLQSLIVLRVGIAPFEFLLFLRLLLMYALAFRVLLLAHLFLFALLLFHQSRIGAIGVGRWTIFPAVCFYSIVIPVIRRTI